MTTSTYSSSGTTLTSEPESFGNEEHNLRIPCSPHEQPRAPTYVVHLTMSEAKWLSRATLLPTFSLSAISRWPE